MIKRISGERMWKVAEYLNASDFALPAGRGKLNALSSAQLKDAFERLQALQSPSDAHEVSRAALEQAPAPKLAGYSLAELFGSFAALERNLARRANPLGVKPEELAQLRAGKVSPEKAKRLQRDALTDTFRLFNAAPERAFQDLARGELGRLHGSAAATVTSKSAKPELDLHVEHQRRAETLETLLQLDASGRAPLSPELKTAAVVQLGRFGSVEQLSVLEAVRTRATTAGDGVLAGAAAKAEALIRRTENLSVTHVQLEGGPIKAGGIRAYLNALTAKQPELGHRTDVILPLPGHLDPEQEGLKDVPGSAGSIRDVHGNDVQFKLLKLEDEPQAGGARRTFYFFSDDTYFTPRRGLYNDEESQTAFGDAHARLLAGSALAGAAMSKVAALRKLGGGDRLTDAQVTAAEEHLEPTDVPDVIQYNDSHLAMLHPYLQHNEVFRHSAPLGIIHQGEDAYQTYIDRSLVERQLGELGGGFADALPSDGAWPSLANMMALTMTMGTVSHGYREQLLDSGTNLQSALQVAASEGRFFSYPNGVDLEATHPANFSGALTPYSADDLSGKVANKTALQKKLGLSVDARAPLFGFGNRIASQKGLQELVKVSGADAQGQPVSPLDTVLRENPRLQLVLGGPVEEPALVPDLEAFAARWPNNVRLQLGYVDNKELMAASDVFMMPSNEEPGGIAQIEAQNEGCAILATDAAGFLRSVPPYDARTGEGTGFIATRYDPASYTTALRNAVEWASKPPAEKAPVQRSAMQWAQNFDSLSWAKYQRALMRQAFVNHQDVLGA